MIKINQIIWINLLGRQVSNHLYIIYRLVMAVRLFCRRSLIIRRKLRRWRFSRIRRRIRSSGLIWKLGRIFFMGLILSLRFFRRFWLIFRRLRVFRRCWRKRGSLGRNFVFPGFIEQLLSFYNTEDKNRNNYP